MLTVAAVFTMTPSTELTVMGMELSCESMYVAGGDTTTVTSLASTDSCIKTVRNFFPNYASNSHVYPQNRLDYDSRKLMLAKKITSAYSFHMKILYLQPKASGGARPSRQAGHSK